MNRHRTPWQDHDADDLVTWTPAEPTRAVEGPLPLDLFRDRLLVLDLAPGQIAVHVVNDRTYRVYLDTMHQLELGDHPGQTAPEGWLVFLRPDAPLSWRWSDSSLLHVNLGGGEELELPLRGRCSVLVSDPLRFHEAALRGVDEAPVDRLTDIVDTLVRSQLEARLHDLVSRHRLDTVQAKVLLEGLTAADLDDELQALGLSCHHLTVAVPVARESEARSHDRQPVACYDDIL